MSKQFDISFIGKSWQDSDGSWESVRLTLGETEDFEAADLSQWTQEEYRRQWISELRALTRSAEKGALIVSLNDPTKGYRIWVWTMWKHQDHVLFQNRLLFASEVARGFDPSHISDFIGDYRSHSESGERISERSVPLASIQEFVERASAVEN